MQNDAFEHEGRIIHVISDDDDDHDDDEDYDEDEEEEKSVSSNQSYVSSSRDHKRKAPSSMNSNNTECSGASEPHRKKKRHRSCSDNEAETGIENETDEEELGRRAEAVRKFYWAYKQENNSLAKRNGFKLPAVFGDPVDIGSINTNNSILSAAAPLLNEPGTVRQLLLAFGFNLD
jgi:hypothetical protein